MTARRDQRYGGFAPAFLLLVGLVMPRPLAGQATDVRAGGIGTPKRASVEAAPAEADFKALLGNTGDERRIPERLRHRDRAAVQRIAGRLRAGGSFEDVREEWSALIRTSRDEDVHVLVQWVMRDAYGEQVAAFRGRDDPHARQRMQQTLQTMSNVSKSMHDTAKASIQNVRG